MELRHLRYFVTLAEELNFGRAARRLHMAQPPLSRQIQSLEQELGTPLFERLLRGLRLTPAGEEMLAGARRVLAEVERAVERARGAARGETGRVMLAHSSAAEHGSLVAALVHTMAELHPGVQVELRQMNTGSAWEAVRDRTADAALTYFRPWFAPELRAVPLLDDPITGVLLSDRHPLASRERLSLPELEPHPMLYIPRSLSGHLYDYVLQALAERGLNARVGQESASIAVLVAMVAEGDGWMLATPNVAAQSPPGTVFRAFAEAPIPFGVALLWRADDEPAPVAALAAAARHLAATLPRPGASGAGVDESDGDSIEKDSEVVAGSG